MKKPISILLAAAAFFGFNQKADAAGFALIEQSVSAMGTAYASGAAGGEDASTIFFNPAELTNICGNQAILGFHGVLPSSHFHNHGSVLVPVFGLAAVPPSNFSVPFFIEGGNGGNAGENALVGNAYFSMQANDCLWFGLGITSPFGLGTSYDDDWVGRYQALHSALLTVDINPVFAYKINKCWSIGGGLRAVYAHAKLTNMVDYGSITWLSTLPLGESASTIQTFLNSEGFLPQEADGHAIIKGNDWGFGGDFGILYEPCCGTRLGFHWRSQVALHLKGKEKFDRLPAFIEDPSLAGPFASLFTRVKAAAATNTRVKTKLILPDIFLFSAYKELNECWAIMGDITWTRWSLLNRLVLKFDNPNQPDSLLSFRWRDALRYSFGTTYRPACNWIVRGGIAYDQTPVRNKEYRSPRLPDEDRFWLAAGVGYDWNRCLHFDIGYAYLFVKEAKIDKSEFELPEDILRGGLRGKYNQYINIISAQVVWNF